MLPRLSVYATLWRALAPPSVFCEPLPRRLSQLWGSLYGIVSEGLGLFLMWCSFIILGVASPADKRYTFFRYYPSTRHTHTVDGTSALLDEFREKSGRVESLVSRDL